MRRARGHRFDVVPFLHRCTRMPFGKYRGQRAGDCPPNYLLHLQDLGAVRLSPRLASRVGAELVLRRVSLSLDYAELYPNPWEG